MPRIFDNIEQSLLPALKDTLNISTHADFCVGYFNLRGWKTIDTIIEKWTGSDGQQCRLLVGMQRLPDEELRQTYSLLPTEDEISNQTVIRLKKRLAEEFRKQLTLGAPNDVDEVGLRRLSAQLKSGKVVVKLFLRHPLHAKLYLCFRPDPNNPITGFLGSSNLTFSGLSKQGELNIDVLDHDATKKLSNWFNDRWDDQWCIDISKELIQIIDESWARLETPPPYWIYIKMAYHLAEEARAGISEFSIPPDLRGTLLEFQSAAVRIAARHLEKRGGVILGDVVGLGKTLMATALARVFQEPPHSLESLIICPKNLVAMWKGYAHQYRLLAEVVSVTAAQSILPDLRRYRIVIIDESHNLRNREGQRWAAIREYIYRNASRCILLSATPYNKAYVDLGNQLRLFLNPDDVVGIRPEEYLRRDCDGRVDEFSRRHQCPVNALSAFEKSQYPDDWRELMRLFMVRRTRSFVERNYALVECRDCQSILQATEEKCSKCNRPKSQDDRRFLAIEDNSRFYFPKRVPKTLTFPIREKDSNDSYAKLYSNDVVNIVRDLHLPRYGLANYLRPTPDDPPTTIEAEVMQNLSRAGKRLAGFCRISLFKRLESSGYAFLQSVRRHILRNLICLHALESGNHLPIGKQDEAISDPSEDSDDELNGPSLFANENDGDTSTKKTFSLETFKMKAAASYELLRREHSEVFDWLRANLFTDDLAKHLRGDAENLFSILQLAGEWQPEKDNKLAELQELITKKHPNEKVLIFSQFADTVDYVAKQLQRREVKSMAGVTGDADNPTRFAHRFSPESNRVRDHISLSDELRILIATDVLSEGQNLQDAAIVVNYDLPWAIIRLIQRAGRVDRIGQKAKQILCYSFLPADGVERLLRLRSRVRQRLQENAEVVGTDETFFEDERYDHRLRDLFTEKSGILDDAEDNEVDLASSAYQIWKNATDADPSLKKTIANLPNVIFSTKSLSTVAMKSVSIKPLSGVMVYVRTADDNDALAWVDENGQSLTESQHEILRAAACEPNTKALLRLPTHHSLVQQAVANVQKEHVSTGGQLGKPSSARRRVYEKLKDYAAQVKNTLFDVKPLHKAIDDIYERPLTETARDLINREIRGGINDQKLVELVLALNEEDRLCVEKETSQLREPQIICSLGIRND